jgi:hypothetical protein
MLKLNCACGLIENFKICLQIFGLKFFSVCNMNCSVLFNYAFIVILAFYTLKI